MIKFLKIKLIRAISLLVLATAMTACESDDEHFCARYQYVYNQLLEDELPTYGEMKQQLMANLIDPKKDKDQAKFMLFVLEDWHSEIKPEGELTQDFCMRVKRWQYYR
jgi:hypothetical protein